VANTSERHHQSEGDAGLRGEILLENDRLVVQKLVIPPGAREGPPTYAASHLWVQMTPGAWTSQADPARVSRLDAGSVGWRSPADHPEHDEARINAGASPIELLWVRLKPSTASAAETDAMKDYRLVYPEIPGTVLLENDEVVVQRFVVPPGAWEGVHAHPGNQLYVHVTGGTWAVRSGGHERIVDSRTGSVGWYRVVPLSEGHQSGNVGDRAIDLVWITLKR
jgi:quercetin dioxygenase-like cupin family protein